MTGIVIIVIIMMLFVLGGVAFWKWDDLFGSDDPPPPPIQENAQAAAAHAAVQAAAAQAQAAAAAAAAEAAEAAEAAAAQALITAEQDAAAAAAAAQAEASAEAVAAAEQAREALAAAAAEVAQAATEAAATAATAAVATAAAEAAAAAEVAANALVAEAEEAAAAFLVDDTVTPGRFYRYVGYDFSLNTNNIATSTSNLRTALRRCSELEHCQSFVRLISNKNHWFKSARTSSQVPNTREGTTLYSKIDLNIPGVVPEIVNIDANGNILQGVLGASCSTDSPCESPLVCGADTMKCENAPVPTFRPPIRTPGRFYRYVGYDFSLNTNNIATSTSNLITALQRCESLSDCESFVRLIGNNNHWFKSARTSSQVPNPRAGTTLYSKIDFNIPGVEPEIVNIDANGNILQGVLGASCSTDSPCESPLVCGADTMKCENAPVPTPGRFYRYVGYDFSLNTNNIATSTSNLITALQRCDSMSDCESFVRLISTRQHWFKSARTSNQVPNPREGTTLYSKIDFNIPGVVPEIVNIE